MSWKTKLTSSPTKALSLTLASWPEETTSPSTPTLKTNEEKEENGFMIWYSSVETHLTEQSARQSDKVSHLREKEWKVICCITRKTWCVVQCTSRIKTNVCLSGEIFVCKRHPLHPPINMSGSRKSFNRQMLSSEWILCGLCTGVAVA